MPVRPSECTNSAPTEPMSVKSSIEDSMKICREHPNFGENRRKMFGALHEQVGGIVVCDIKSK